MKTIPIFTLLIALVLTFSGCREISVSTKVNTDGSFTRVITITGDSADVFKKNLPYPIDESWLMEVKRDSADSSLYVTYTKDYENDKLLAVEIQADTGRMRILEREVSIKKRFGFFYSYLTFDEVIKATNPFHLLNISDFLSPIDMQWLSNERLPNSASDTAIMNEVEERAMEFLAESITLEIIQILEKGITDLNDPSLSPKIVEQYKDSIIQLTEEWAFDNPESIVNDLANWSGKPKIVDILKLDPYIFNDYNKKLEIIDFTFEMEDYAQKVSMPGLITETNSIELKGNTVRWEVQALSFLLSDYKMHVESRVINYWVFVIAGLILLILIILLAIKAFK